MHQSLSEVAADVEREPTAAAPPQPSSPSASSSSSSSPSRRESVSPSRSTSSAAHNTAASEDEATSDDATSPSRGERGSAGGSQGGSGSSDPLTKAKLFTQSDEDGDWIEIGVGIVTIVMDTATPTAPSDAAAMLEMAEIGTDEMLMRTPVSPDDIYMVQRSSILIWQDPEIGKSVAVSFSNPAGCTHIVEAIRSFQDLVRSRTSVAAAALSASRDVGRMGGGMPPRNHGGGSLLSNGESSIEESRESPWTVKRENLPALVLAAQDNKHRFANYLISTPTFFRDVLGVYTQCCENGDVVGKGHIGRLTMALLAQPFNTENKILMQLVDRNTISGTIDIVQFAIHGERNPSRIETEQQRLAKFANPGGLPDDVVSLIHYIFALQFLRDLVPLCLDDGEPGGSMLGLYLLRMKLSIYHDICVDPTFLPQYFRKHVALQDSASEGVDDLRRHFSAAAAFLLELTSNIKNAMIPEDGKISILTELTRRGLCDFAQTLLSFGLQHCDASIVAKAADVMAHTVMFSPNSMRLELMKQVERYHDALVAAAAAAVTSASVVPCTAPDLVVAASEERATPAALAHPQQLFAASGGSPQPRQGEEVGADVDDQPREGTVKVSDSAATPQQCTAPSTSSGESPTTGIAAAGHRSSSDPGVAAAAAPRGPPLPFLHLIMRAITVVDDPIAAQCVYDCISAIGVGLLQKSAGPQLTGPQTVPLRQRVLRYWVEGTARPQLGGTVAVVGGSLALSPASAASLLPSRTPSGTGTAPADGAGTADAQGGASPPTGDLHLRSLEDPPLGTLLAAFCSHVLKCAGLVPTGGRVARSSGRLSSSMGSDLIPFHTSKALVLILRQRFVTASPSFLPLLLRHDFIRCLATVVSGSATVSSKLRCNAFSLAADLVCVNDETFLRALVDGGLLDACATALRDNRRRNNILSSAARNVFSAVHTSVTEKRATLAQSAASPLLSLGFSRSPFGSNLTALYGDASNTQQPDVPGGTTVTTFLVAHVLEKYAADLAVCGASDTVEHLQRVLAGDEPSKTGDASVVPSTSSQISNEEYVRLLADFGVQPAASLDDDDDDLATGGEQPFRLRRQSSIRRGAATAAAAASADVQQPSEAPAAATLVADLTDAVVPTADVALLLAEEVAEGTDLPSKRKRMEYADQSGGCGDGAGTIFDD